MNGSELRTFFYNLIGETSLDETFTYQLLNNAYHKREAEMELEILKKVDSSNTTTVGATYTTEISLPTDFFTPIKVMLNTIEQNPIMFEEQVMYKDAGGYYFIDHANSKLRLTGTISKAETIYIFYIYETNDIGAATSPVFPNRFHPLLAYDAAELYLAGIDTDEQNRTMAPQHREEAKRLNDAMVQWNTKLKLMSMDNSAKRRQPYQDSQGFVRDNVIR